MGNRTWLTTMRERAGLTQAQLAKEVGVFQSEVSSWETGRCRVGPTRVRPLAKALGVDVVALHWLRATWDMDIGSDIAALDPEAVAAAVRPLVVPRD